MQRLTDSIPAGQVMTYCLRARGQHASRFVTTRVMSVRYDNHAGVNKAVNKPVKAGHVDPLLGKDE